MKRREFVKLCASAVAGVSASPELLGEREQELHFYERVNLVDSYNKKPVRAASLEVGETIEGLLARLRSLDHPPAGQLQ